MLRGGGTIVWRETHQGKKQVLSLRWGHLYSWLVPVDDCCFPFKKRNKRNAWLLIHLFLSKSNCHANALRRPWADVHSTWESGGRLWTGPLCKAVGWWSLPCHSAGPVDPTYPREGWKSDVKSRCYKIMKKYLTVISKFTPNLTHY